jgi:hypothetical protein
VVDDLELEASLFKLFSICVQLIEVSLYVTIFPLDLLAFLDDLWILVLGV